MTGRFRKICCVCKKLKICKYQDKLTVSELFNSAIMDNLDLFGISSNKIKKYYNKISKYYCSEKCLIAEKL